MTELSHIVRTQHFDTGQIVMMCGEQRESWDDPAPGTALCAGCGAETINVLKHRLEDSEARLKVTRRVMMRESIAASEEIEALASRLGKMEKKAKKAKAKDKG